MTNQIFARFLLNYGEFKLDVDLSLPETGITVLFGASGSGKTTLLRCIAGLQTSQTGYLTINNQVWQDSDKKIFVPTFLRCLGYVFQEANLLPHLTVLDNLCFGLKRLATKVDKGKLADMINLLGIEHLLSRMPDQLSGGERQRVAIARALVLQPAILLMDEPLASLDFQRKQEILPFLRRLHRELSIPVLYVTHSQYEVAQLADYVLMLSEGKVLASGGFSETIGLLDTSLNQDQELVSVWQVKVLAHDQDNYLTKVQFDGGVLEMPYFNVELGTQMGIQIFANDVSITLNACQDSSILNILPATIIGLRDIQVGQIIVSLSVGKQRLLGVITRRSVFKLGLKIGLSVFVQIKGTSILN